MSRSPKRPSGDVYAFGWNEFAQLGLGEDGGRYEPSPQRLKALPSGLITTIGAGHSTSFAADAEGNVWSWGRGRDGNVIPGDYHGDHPLPTLISDFFQPYSRKSVVDVGGSGVVTYVQCEGADNEGGGDASGVYVFGSSKRGQLGLGRGVLHCGMDGTMKRVMFDGEAVKRVKLGWGHGVGLMEDGRVVSWGFNESGQIGRIQKDDDGGEVGLVDFSVDADSQKRWKGLDIGAGFDHCSVVVQGGDVFSWGLSETSAMGLGDELQQAARAQLVKFTSEADREPISRVECGFGHSLFIDIHGGLLSCGWNDRGQLGISPEKVPERGTFARVPRLEKEKIVDVSVGRVNSAAVSHNGVLYTWGGGTHGRLGQEDTKDVHEPQMVHPDLFDNRRVLNVACGLDHTLVLVESE